MDARHVGTVVILKTSIVVMVVYQQGDFGGYSVFLRVKLPAGWLNLGESLALFYC